MCSVRSPLITAVVWRTVWRTNGIAIASCASTVTSCALEYAPGRVEPVGAHEVRVVEAERPRLRVHQLRERVEVGRDRERERVGGVVRRLDQRRLDELAHGDLLAAAEGDALLPDRGRARCRR